MMTTELIIKKDDVLIGFERELDELIEEANLLVIDSPDKAALAIDTIGHLGKFAKKMNDRRLDIVRPYQAKLDEFKAEIDVIIAKGNIAKSQLETKGKAYALEMERQEQERIRAQKIAEEKARIEAEQAEIAKVAMENDIPGLFGHVALKEEEKQEIIEETLQEDPNVKFRAYGNSFSGGLKDNWTATVDDVKALLEFILKTERFELIDKFSQAKLNSYAKSVGKEQTINGLKIVNDRKISTRA